MIRACSQPYRLRLIGALALLVISACGSTPPVTGDAVSTAETTADERALKAAVAAYARADYAQALVQFQVLANTHRNKALSRSAHLGEICASLMLAETQAEYNAALDRWRNFVEADAGSDSAFPLMLFRPLIEGDHRPSMDRSADPASPPVMRDQSGPEADTAQQLRQALADMKKKADQSEVLRQRVSQLTSENEMLKKKINALEAIDQNIQKKKTEISAPGE